MSRRSITLTDQLRQYLLSDALRESATARRCREETTGHEWASMQISPELGQLLALLTRMLNAQRILELGVFTGYSSLCMAEALPAGGKLIACDVKKEYTDKAEQYWRAGGVAEKVALRLAPALETLRELTEAGEAGRFDLIFVDAVKEEYPAYYPLAYGLLRPGGLMAMDNTLWGGSVADPEKQGDETRAIREFNLLVQADERVDVCLLPVGDGVSLIRKRAAD